MDGSKLSEKNLIVEVSGASFGFNAATGKFDQKVVWSKDISLLFRKFDNLVDCEQNSGSVNILSTLKHYLLEMKRLHLEDAEIIQLLLYFAKNYLPHSYSALSRYQDNITALFEELLNILGGPRTTQNETQLDETDKKATRQTNIVTYKAAIAAKNVEWFIALWQWTSFISPLQMTTEVKSVLI